MSLVLLPQDFLIDLRDAADEARTQSDIHVLRAVLENHKLEAVSEEAFDEMHLALERYLNSGHNGFDEFKRVVKASVRHAGPAQELMAGGVKVSITARNDPAPWRRRQLPQRRQGEQ
jgi:hypothetical protein